MGTENDVGFVVEQDLMQSYFGEPALIISKKKFDNGWLVLWRNACSLPTIKACSFTSVDGKISVPNTSEDIFRAAFLEVKPDLSKVADMCELLEAMSPGLRSVIVKLKPYMSGLAGAWHEPVYKNGRFEAFIENLTSGVIERLILDEHYQITVEVVCDGVKLDLR